jgi:hypothetical protein
MYISSFHCPDLGLELEIRSESSLRASYVSVVAELVLHRSEEDAARIHVWLGDEAVFMLAFKFPSGAYTYNRSPVFKSLKTAMPSIILAAEFPRNLLLGFKVPSMRMLCSGAMKK